MQEYSKYIDDDMKQHAVFYSVCQAFFHLFIARHKEFISSKNGKYKFIVHICYRFSNDSFEKSIFVFFQAYYFFKNLIYQGSLLVD